MRERATKSPRKAASNGRIVKCLAILAESGWITPGSTLFLIAMKKPAMPYHAVGGIPNSLRKQWWMIQLKKPSKDFNLLLQYHTNIIPHLETTGLDGEILRDLDRTFPNEPYFHPTAIGQVLLANVLKAISLQLPDIGYCQGMNFIAAKLLLIWKDTSNPDEVVFHILAGVCQEHSSFWSPGMPGLRKCIFALYKLIERHLPLLHGHLRRIGMHAGYFATQWFVTLFSRILPLATFIGVWDHFLVDGMKMLYRIALVILKYMQPDLITMDMEEASMYLCRNPKLHIDTMSNTQLIQESRRFKVTRSILNSLEQQREIEMLRFRLSPRKAMDNLVFFPEIDTNRDKIDDKDELDRLRHEINGMEKHVAIDVAVFRKKIERIHRAAEAASVRCLQATALMSEAAYHLDEIIEWKQVVKSQINTLFSEVDTFVPSSQDTGDVWYRRLFTCFDGHARTHVQLQDADETEKFELIRDRLHFQRKLKRLEEELVDARELYQLRRTELLSSQIELEESVAFKAKMTEQFIAVLNGSEAEKVQLLRRRFQAMDHIPS